MRKGSITVTPPSIPEGPITLEILRRAFAAQVDPAAIGDEEMSDVSWAKVIAGMLTGDKVLQMSGAGVILKSANYTKDERHFTAPLLSNLTKTISSTTANFAAADVGREVTGLGLTEGTTIASVTSPTEAELSHFPGAPVLNAAIFMPGRPVGAGWALFGDGTMEMNVGTIFRGTLKLSGFTAEADGTVKIGSGTNVMTALPDGSFTWGSGGAIIGITPAGEFFVGGLDYASSIVRIAANGDLTVRNTAQSMHSINIGAIDTTILAPTATPPGGAFDTSVNVDLLCQTQGVKIYYTVDGSTPDATKTLYTGAPIALAADTTLKAIAIKLGVSSSVMTATFNEDAGAAAPNPVADPVGGDYSPAGGLLSVELSANLAGASIRYTTDGSTPSEVAGTLISPPNGATIPSGTIQLAVGTTTLKMIAFKTGTHTNSGVVTEVYVITSGGSGGGGGDGGGRGNVP